jgi:hypothetical protein
MRNLIMALFYLLMMTGGAYLWWGWFDEGGFVAGGSLLVFGAYMLWQDFLSPNRP